MTQEEIVTALLDITTKQSKNLEELIAVSASSENRLQKVNHIVDTLTSEYTSHLDNATNSRDAIQRTLETVAATNSQLAGVISMQEEKMKTLEDRYERLLSVIEHLASGSPSTSVSVNTNK